MATYVDGFVFSVPKKKKATYIKLAKEASVVWKKYGALDFKECRLQDVKPKSIIFTFPKIAKAKSGEEVWFSFITFKSRAHRDLVNKKARAYFNKKYPGLSVDMPFDMKRMAYGGFTTEVE